MVQFLFFVRPTHSKPSRPIPTVGVPFFPGGDPSNLAVPGREKKTSGPCGLQPSQIPNDLILDATGRRDALSGQNSVRRLCTSSSVQFGSCEAPILTYFRLQPIHVVLGPTLSLFLIHIHPHPQTFDSSQSTWCLDLPYHYSLLKYTLTRKLYGPLAAL